MLMLTHTWVLRELCRRLGKSPREKDAYIFNVAPDLLTIHPDISSAMTHAVPRLVPMPPEDANGAYVQFHLLVDDMAHYGRIGLVSPGEFDPGADGYSYRQGRFLVTLLEDFHRRIGREVPRSEAIYQSHMMVEMAFDLNLHLRGNGGLLDLFLDSLEYTAAEGLAGFAGTLSRLMGIGQNVVAEALVRGWNTYDRPRMEAFLSPEGRTAGFMDKFRLDREDRDTCEGVWALMERALEATRDREGFLGSVLEAVGQTGFRLPL
ncbi:MAG: hypothetical protein HPY65_08745 [Syntrophaceae bacterium]|nr:hypothetical protein [Syntrophaceae bacterium]